MATKRPASLIVFGILNLIFGLMGLMGTVVVLLLSVLQPEMPGGAFDVQRVLEERLPWYGTYTMVSSVIGAIVSLIVIAAGIGLMMGREWARKATIGYGIYGIVVGLVGAWLNLGYITPVLKEMLETANEIERTGIIGGIVGGYGGLCFAIIYPVLVLIFMNRQVVKDATAGASGAEDQLD